MHASLVANFGSKASVGFHSDSRFNIKISVSFSLNLEAKEELRRKMPVRLFLEACKPPVIFPFDNRFLVKWQGVYLFIFSLVAKLLHTSVWILSLVVTCP